MTETGAKSFTSSSPGARADVFRTYQLVYYSTSLIPTLDSQGREEIENILSVATLRNTHRKITGALTFNEVYFAQVLEGSRTDVKSVFSEISRDPRHMKVTVLQEGWVGARDFAQWAMAYVGEEASLHFLSSDVGLEDILLRDRPAAALILIEMMKFWLSHSM